MKKIPRFLVFTAFFLSGTLLFAQNAQELRVGVSPVRGSLKVGDEIWYSVRANENGFLIVETAGETDTYLEAFDAQRNLLRADDDGGDGYNARIEVRAVSGRTYLFKLTGYDNTEAGPYSIWARIESIPAATELRFGTLQQGTLAEGSRNWYSVQAAERSVIIVETIGDLDTYIEVYDSQYNLIAEDDDGGSGYNARVEIPAERSQTYLFLVRGYDDWETGHYRIVATTESR